MGNKKYEEYWENRKKEFASSSGKSSPSVSRNEKYASYWAEKFASSLPEKIESLSSSRDKLYKDYTSRFTDKDGNYINAFRGDTKDALTSFKSSKANIDNESKAILEGLSAYEKYLDADTVKSVRDYLTGYSGDLDSMYETYQTDYDYFSRFKDEDSYNRAMTYAKEQEEKKNKYSAMSDDELNAEIERLKESKKGNALSNFAMRVVGAQDSNMNLYAEAESNQAYNDSVNYDISLIEAEKTNRKYKQLDTLPEDVKALIDEYTSLDTKKDYTTIENIAQGFSRAFNQNTGDFTAETTGVRRREIAEELESKGVDNWQELVGYNRILKDGENNKALNDETEKFAKDHPVLSSVATVLASPTKMLGAVEMLENAVAGSDVPLNYNSPYFVGNDFINTTRDTVMDEHDFHLNTGNRTLDNIDLFDELYSTGMSIGDSVSAGVSLGGVGGVALGLSAATDSAQEVAEKGGSATEAIVTGLVSGVNEMLWESVSLGRLNDLLTNGVSKRGFKAFVKELFKSMGINASEELNTEASNLLADYLINGGASTYSETVQNYLAMGYSEDEAKAQAKKDMLVQVSKAGVGGALQGLIMGGGAGGISTVSNAIDSKAYENKYYNKMGQNIIDQGNLSQLEEEAKTLGGKDVLKALKNLADETAGVKAEELDDKGKKKYAHQVGKLYKGVQKAQFKSLNESSKTAFKNVIKAELEKTGIDSVDATADILVKAAHNESLTRAESRLLQSVNGHEILNKAYSSKDFVETLSTEEEKQFEESRDNILDTVDLTHDKGKAKILAESNYDVSSDGTTIIEATGEGVNLMSVDSLEGDDISFKVKNGDSEQVVLAGELRLNEDYVVILEGLKDIKENFGLDVSSANSVLALWDSYTGNAVDFSKAMKSGIMYGQYNLRKDFENSRMGRAIPDNIREELFRIGREYKQRVTDERESDVRANGNANAENGEFSITYAEGVTYESLNESQKAQVDFAQVIAKTFGFNLELFRSPKNALGQSVGENGSYNLGTNTMRLDVDAGELNGKSLILFTQAHELTHFIKKWSPKAFKTFADLLIEKYDEKGVPVDNLVNDKITQSIMQTKTDKTGKHHVLSYEEAFEEVVCDACEDFLADPNIQQTIAEFAKVDKTLAQKIKDFLKGLITKLEEAIKGLQGQSKEAKALRELDIEDLEDLKNHWAAALFDARENVLQAKESDAKAEKNTTDEGDVNRYSFRNSKTGMANDNLLPYDELRVLLEQNGNYIVDSFEKLVYITNLAFDKPQAKATSYFGILSPEILSKIEENVPNLPQELKGELFKPNQSYSIAVTLDSIRHLIDGKGLSREDVLDYLDRLADTIIDFDTVNFDYYYQGQIKSKGLVFRKTFDDGIMQSFEIVSNKKKSLNLQTIYMEKGDYKKKKSAETLLMDKPSANVQDAGRSNFNGSISNPTKNVNTTDEKRQDRDSLGRTLTEKQQSYFAESKIRDKNGKLMVMYHGSPKDDISSFRLSLGGAYFTANSDYAREYARDVGKVYEVYLNITQPFDTRNAECRAIFEKEFYGQWGNGAPLGDKGLPDWTDGDDLIDFLQEKGYDYDGLLLDEGGVPVGNGVKDRGISYVVFDRANQVKYTDNLNPTENEDMKFSLRENVEETKDLVAVHNLSEENLLKSLKLGGLPMPSIAIIKAKNGHNSFGDISLVFDKSSIDPKLSKYNKVFTSDAYTPTYPHIEYKIDSDVVEKGVDEIERLIKSKGYIKDAFGYLSSISGDSFRYGNTEEVANKLALKVAYLIDKGIDFTPIYEEKQYSGFGTFDNEIIKYIADVIGRKRINELHNNSEGVKKALEEIRNLASEYKAEKYKDKEDLFKLLKENPYFGENNFGFAQAHEIVEGAYNYFNNGNQTKIDEWQTSREIKDLIDNDGYKKWVDNLFDGFIEKEGIRNNVDLFTPSGNRRSFEALHWEHNLENVIKSMRSGLQQGNALFGSSIYGASQSELKSIADIKNESDRLVNVDSEENKVAYREKREDLELRFTELVSSIVRDNGGNYFIAMDDASAVLVESVLKCKTKTAMDNYIKRELEGWGNYSPTLAEDLMDIVNELRALPTGYFEAKPQRAVMFDEVKAVIIPDNAPQELKEQLDSTGLNVLTYEHGNDNSRTEVLNSIENVKFQDRVTPEEDAEYLELAKNPEKNKVRLREMVEKAANANGYRIKAYHGTPSNNFTTFDTKKIGSNTDAGIFGSGFYFTTHKETAGVYATESGHTMPVYLRVNNPWWAVSHRSIQDVAEELGMDKDALTLRGYGGKGRIVTPTMSQTGQFSAHLQEHGYDAVVVQHGSNNYEIVVFDSDAIKSAVPITYDDNGNIIPLSERFNEGNDDIRYQDRRYQPTLEDLGIDYKEENERLKADVDRLKEMLKLQGTVTHGKSLAKASYEGVAKKLLHEFGMKRVTDTEVLKEFINKLDSFYSYIINEDDLIWEDMFDKSMEIARWIDSILPEQVVYKNPNAVAILRDIREKGIMLSDKQKEEATYYAGSLNAYRKMNIGNFRIVNEGGISLTDLWEQLVTDYPGAISKEYIQKGEVAENLPSLIVEVVDLMRQTEKVINDDNRLSHLREIATAIYDSYWQIPTVRTLADKHQQKVNLLKGQHKAEMDALKEKNDSKLKDTKEYYQDMVKRIRADKDAKMDAYKERVQEQKKKNVEGRNKTTTKNKIKRVIKTLESLYSNPTKEKNIKIEFQDMVNKALIMADVLFDDGKMSSSDILSGEITIDLTADERKLINEWKKVQEAREGYRNRLDVLESSENADQNTHDELLKMISKCNHKLNDLGRKLSGVVERQRGNLNDHSVQNAIDSLVEAYKSLEDSTEGYAKAAYNDYVAKRLDALKTSLKNTTVKTMTLTQLDELYQAYKMVLTTVRTANELFVNNKKMSVEDMGEKVIGEVMRVAKPTENKLVALRGIREFSWEELKPIYAFERIGSKTLLELFMDARKGEDVLGMDLADAEKFFREKSKAYGYDSWDFDERKDFRLIDGRTFNLSLQEIMSIYAYSKREQALDHITKGGFVFDDKEFFTDTKEKGLKGKIKKERTTVEAYRLGVPDFQKIINSLTKEQKKFIDDMQEYLSEVMGAKGNEVSRVLYGIDLFKEQYYFPLMSSNDFIQQTNNPVGEVALKNSGMAKATVPHARNPIVLQGFMDVWANHVNKMSTYHALVLPIENLNKVFNYTGYARDNHSVSVQTILKGAYGDAVNRYISNFITDLNGGIKTQSSGNWVTKGVSLFKKTAVAGSTSVVIQQPTAIVRAMAMINPKYFVHGADGLKHNDAWEELKKYAPVAIIKEMGGFDVGSGRKVAEYITAKEYKGKDKVKGFFTDSAYRDDALMWGATKADEIGWITIWNAVKKEIADTTTYKNGSEDFLKACGERFTEIITYTQVYDSVFSRSGFMRNKGEISKMATSFMGEPTTSFNMLYNAILQAKRGNISKGEMTKIMGATVSSIILASIAKSLVYALRDDDDDESYAEKYAQSLTSSLMDDLFIPNMLPYVSDITSLLSGWDVERTDMAVLKDLKDAVDGLDSSSKSLYRKIEDLAGAVAAFGGIPAKNVMRTVREMYNLMANVLDDNTASADDVGDAVVETITGEKSASDINEALEKGKTDKAKEIISDLVADKVEEGKTEKEAKTSIKSSVTSYWKPLYLQAYRDNDSAEMLRIRRILQSTGLYDNVVETCSNWIKGMKDEPTESKYKKQ